MARKFLTPIDLNLLELQNAVIQNLATNPSSGNVDGRIYYNTVSDEMRVYSDGTWVAVGSGDINDVVGTADEVTVVVASGTATVSLPATINANTTGSAATLTTARAIEISGDVTGTANFNGSAAINISTTIAANSVALGTDTTGDYIATLTGTANQITVTGAGTEGRTPTLSLPSAVTFPGTVTLNADPSTDLEAATKQYVDGVAQGLDVKASAVAATTENGTLATAFDNGSVIDGVTLATGNRILIKNQTDATVNGIYTVNASGAPTRSTDMNADAEFPGAFVFIEQGTTNADCGFVCTNNSVTIGTTSVTFTQFSGAGVFTAGNGITLTGTAFSIDTSITADLATAQTFTNKTLTSPTVSGLYLSDSSIVMEGSSADAHETTLTATNPTADRTVTFQDATGTVVLRDSTDTLTNKTLTSPTVSGLTLSDGSIVIEGATGDAYETTLTVTDPTADRTITFQDASGTVAFTSAILRYSASVGNNSATSIAVTHSLATRDVVVQVYDNTTYETVECDVVRTDTNTVTLGFAVAPASNGLRIVVTA